MWINAIKVNGQLENTYIYTEKETLSIGILKYVCSSNINRFLTYSSLSLKLKLQPAKIRSVHDWVWPFDEFWFLVMIFVICRWFEYISLTFRAHTTLKVVPQRVTTHFWSWCNLRSFSNKILVIEYFKIGKEGDLVYFHTCYNIYALI